MTAREPADRPTPSKAAAELMSIAGGGQATTVLASSAAVPAADRTQVLSRTTAAPRPQPTYARHPVAAPRRSNGPWLVALLGVVALLAAGAVLLSQQEQQSPTEPLPTVDLDLPEPLRNDLQQLQQEVES